MRSLATRDFGSEISAALPDVLAAVKVAGFDLVIVETSGIGQGDAAIVPLVDVPVYVMTPEFGAASQLEKIDMLDFAEFVAINKFDRKGAADALRDVAKQVQRNREAFAKKPDEMPVFGTMASRFNDDGVTALYQAMLPRLGELGLKLVARHAAQGRDAAQHAPGADRSRCARRATWPTSSTRCAPTSSGRAIARRAWRARSSSCGRARACCREANPDETNARRRRHRPGRGARGAPATRARDGCSPNGRDCSMPTPATSTSSRVRDTRDPHAARSHDPLGHQDAEGRAAGLRGRRRDPQVAAARQRAGLLPVHRGHVRLQARERGPDADVRRRGRRLPDQHPLQAALGRACRPSACRPRSTRSRSTATTRRCGPTSTARSATRASRSRRSTT